MEPASVDPAGSRHVTLAAGVRGSLAAAGLAGVLLCAAGCGGSGAPAVARIATTDETTPTSGSYDEARIRWAACIRKHGVPSFPDPNSQGGVDIAGVDIDSPQFIAAHQACRSLEVANPPAVVQQQIKQERAVAQCMRKHGVSDFPGPNAHGRIPQTQAANWRTWTSTPIGAKAARICNPGTG